MYTDLYGFKEFPYKCSFYRSKGIDESLPLDQQTDEEVVVFTSECDMNEASHELSSNFISAAYTIHLPFQSNIVIENGDRVVCDTSGIQIEGKVIGIFPSQLGVKVYVKDINA